VSDPEKARESPVLQIAIVRPFFSLNKGGAERYAVELSKALVAGGHAVHVFAYEWDEPKERGISYHRVNMIRKPSWLRVLTFHWNLRRALVFTDFDVVLGMTPSAPQMVYWLGDGLYRVWTRLVWPLKPIRWLMCLRRAVMSVNLCLERKVMQGGAFHFIANSNLVKRQAVSQYNVPEEKISVVYPGVDLKRFHAGSRQQWRSITRRTLGIGEEEIVLLFVSNNFYRKGLRVVFRSLKKILRRHPQVRLLVVGAGRIWLYKVLARRLGIHERVTFTGSTAAIERCYAASDIFVLPTRYDPFAAVCLEAMACGLPVVTTRMNGAGELIHEGQSGFLLDHWRNEEQLEERIQQLLDPRKRADMSLLAAARARAFALERHVCEMGAVLEGVATRRRECQQVRAVPCGPNLVVNEAYLSILQRHGLASYDVLIKTDGTTAVTYNWAKRIFLSELRDLERSITLYSKRHRSRFSLQDWFRWLIGKSIRADGMREWDNILAFRSRALPTVTPVAAGERILSRGIKESFVVTLGLDEFTPLDDYMKARFVFPLDQARLKEKRRVIRAAAQLTRQMHWTRLNHRDYYLCHLFVRPEEDGKADLRLIDLQRAGHRMMPFRRWRIKDLAELQYSSLTVPFSNWDRLRFYAVYSAGEEDRIERRRLLRRVLRKSKAISTHDARLQRRRGTQSGAQSSLMSIVI
jgi:UDP-glucose:(heptosyl)LPS alpha-1,3-glucosyltransferase